METSKKILTPEEETELRKSLTDLGMSEEEVNSWIEKSMKEEETGKEETIEEKAEGKDGKEVEENREKNEDDDEEEMEKSMSDDELIEKCNGLKMQKSLLEKSINRIETKLGIKGGEDLKKSIDEDIIKSIEVGITNKIEERISDIQKSIEESVVSKLDEKYKGLNAEEIRSDIEKSLSDQLKDIKEEVKKIGDTPIGRKAIITNGANFFEKGNLDELNDEEKEGKKLSITKDRDEIIKSMQDMFDKSTDTDEKAILQDGITDITVNKSPTNHGIRALGLMLRKKNITLEQ